MSIRVTKLCLERRGRRLLGPVDLRVSPSGPIGVVGPNGSGKSSLLRLLYGFFQPTSGEIFLEERPLDSYAPQRLARLLGVCPQEAEPTLDFTVQQALSLGYSERPAQPPELDLDFLRLPPLFQRRLSELSGGEKQRVRLARALMGSPKWLLLDEPVNHLDLRTSWALFERLAQLPGRGILIALHDLQLAVRFCTQLVVLDRGELRGFGPTTEVLTTELLADVFGLRAAVEHDGGAPRLRIDGLAPERSFSKLDRRDGSERGRV